MLNNLEVAGAERFVVTLARAQRDVGHSVRVHCLFGSGPLAEDLIDGGVPLTIGVGGSLVGRLREVAEALRAFSPDVVHCHNVGPTLLGAPLARLFGARCVISTRHGAGADPSLTWWRGARFWIAARACSHVVSVSDATTRALSREPFASPSRLVTILNGAQAPAVGRVDRSRGRVVLLSVARLAWPKDHPTLIRAVAAVRPTLPDLELWLVGDGPDRPALERLCEQLDVRRTVRFLGVQREVGAWLAQADLFVLSSLAEGAPLALMEALAAGVFPIATAVGGVREIIERSGVGMLVPAGDDAALAAAIVNAVGQRDRWPEWQQQARAAYERHFTFTRMCDEYEHLMAGALGAARASVPV